MTKNIDLTLLVSVLTDARELTLDREGMIDYQNARVSAREYDALVDKLIKLLSQWRNRLVNLQAFYDAIPDSVNETAKNALAVTMEEVKTNIADLERVISGE